MTWEKVVVGAVALSATLAFGLLLLAWRDRTRTDLTDELCGCMAMFGGIVFGVLWEVSEFIRDWVAYSELQTSNTDTMTDLLVNDVAAVVAALLAVRIYCRAMSASDKTGLGTAAEWLVDGPSQLLNRHGLALATVTLGVIAAAVLTLWFTGRPVPGFAIP